METALPGALEGFRQAGLIAAAVIVGVGAACRLLMPVTSWLRHRCDVSLVLVRIRLPCGAVAGWTACPGCVSAIVSRVTV